MVGPLQRNKAGRRELFDRIQSVSDLDLADGCRAGHARGRVLPVLVRST
jgi:hypothetical protein